MRNMNLFTCSSVGMANRNEKHSVLSLYGNNVFINVMISRISGRMQERRNDRTEKAA